MFVYSCICYVDKCIQDIKEETIAMPEDKSFSFEGRLSRSKGRTGRDRVVSSRATADEHQELETAAKAEGKALSE